MEEKMMKSNGVDSCSSAMKRRRLFSAAAVLLAVCLVFVGAAGAAEDTTKPVAKNIDSGKTYTSIQEAVEKATSGDTILVTESHNLLGRSDVQKADNKYNVWILVENKDITIDLNGKTVTADYSNGNWDTYTDSITAIIWVHSDAKLTLTDSSEDKSGALKVIATEANDDRVKNEEKKDIYRVNYMLFNYNGDNHETEGGHSLVINGGTYEYDYGKYESAIVYSQNSKTTLITGGIFKMGNVGVFGESGNYCPWVFNGAWNDANPIVVTGGTFNENPIHRHWEYEVYVPENLAVSKTIDAKGESWWTVVPAVAYVTEYHTKYNSATSTTDLPYSRNVGYATVEEAVYNVGKHHASSRTNDLEQYTITLIKDADVTKTLEFGTSESSLAKPTVFDMKGKKITWKGNTESILTVSGEKLTVNSFNIIREGYTITKWKLDNQLYDTLPRPEDNGQVVVQTSLSIAEPPQANTYTVIFDKNGGKGTMANQEFTYDEEQALTPNAFTMIGYSFDSWNTERDGSGLKYVDNAKVKNLATEGEITLYANWTANTYSVMVTQTEGGTAAASSSSAKYGDEISLTATPNEGYSFIEWVAESNIEISPDGKFTMPAGDVTVEAVFKENSAEGDAAPSTSSGYSSGNYLSFPRTTTNGGLVDFGSSKVVKALMLPEGSSGSVLLKVDTVEKWPKALDTEYTFDISVEKLGDGMAYIHFEIPVSALESLELTPADICAYHFEGEVWTKLPTTYEVKDGTVCYEAATDSFSPFKLVIEEGAAVPKAEENVPVIPPTETPDVPDEPEILPPIDEPTKPADEPETPAPILAVLAGLGAAVIVRRK